MIWTMFVVKGMIHVLKVCFDLFADVVSKALKLFNLGMASLLVTSFEQSKMLLLMGPKC